MGKKRRIMRDFSITEISGVDRPAQAHARAVIMKRDEPDVEGKAGFEIDNGGARARLRLLIENQRRGRPGLSEAEAIAAGWRSLSYKDRNALLAEDDDGQDLAFDHEKVDVAKLADFLLEVRAELISKAQPLLSREKAYEKAVEQHPDVFRVSREAKRAALAMGDTEVLGTRNRAFNELHKRATELRLADPTLTIERARTEARARWPELARLERA
jgi:hypothetical protein